MLLGFGVGALFIPTYRDTLNVAKAAGYPDSFETYGSVSGLVLSQSQPIRALVDLMTL